MAVWLCHQMKDRFLDLLQIHSDWKRTRMIVIILLPHAYICFQSTQCPASTLLHSGTCELNHTHSDAIFNVNTLYIQMLTALLPAHPMQLRRNLDYFFFSFWHTDDALLQGPAKVASSDGHPLRYQPLPSAVAIHGSIFNAHRPVALRRIARLIRLCVVPIP